MQARKSRLLLAGAFAVALTFSSGALIRIAASAAPPGVSTLTAATAWLGGADAQYQLATSHPQPDRAAYWLQKAADSGSAEAQYRVALAYLERADRPHPGAAAVWFTRAAEQGHAGAKTRLGELYFSGNGAIQDYRPAIVLTRDAAMRGVARAQNTLGFMYAEGLGVNRDFGDAARWFMAAARQGDRYAEHNVAVLHDRGLGVARDFRAAAEWYGKAAAQGLAASHTQLGLLHALGRGTKPDVAQAKTHWQAAAHDGDPAARRFIADPALTADYAPAGYSAAARWWYRSAEQWLAPAQFQLAFSAGRIDDAHDFVAAYRHSAQ